MQGEDFDSLLRSAQIVNASAHQSANSFRHRATGFAAQVEEQITADVVKAFAYLRSAGARVCNLSSAWESDNPRKCVRLSHSLGIQLASFSDSEGSSMGTVWLRPDGRMSESSHAAVTTTKSTWKSAETAILLHNGIPVIPGVREDNGLRFRFVDPTGSVIFLPDPQSHHCLTVWCDLETRSSEFWGMGLEAGFKGDARELLARLVVEARERIN